MADEPLDIKSLARRYVAAVLFLAAWMACGWLLKLDANAYLLLGVPLTVFFQGVIRQQPLRALWILEGPPIRLGWSGIAIAAGLSIVPLLSLVESTLNFNWIVSLYSLCSLVGAIGAAYALRNFRPESVRPFIWCLLTIIVLSFVTWLLLWWLGQFEMSSLEGGTPVRVVIGILSLLQYIPVVFVLEEVSFRMLDSHIRPPGDKPGILSAVFISAAWGLWHLPIVDADFTWELVGQLLWVHILFGACLSLFWRRTANLIVPGLGHALADAIRNALIASG